MIIRLLATMVVWAAIVLISTFGNLDVNNFISLAIVLGVGGWITTEIWHSRDPVVKAEKSAQIVAITEKSKRSENRRLSRLIDSLSEEDLATLEAVLAARRDQLDEDEQIELNRLLADQERAHR